MGTVVDQSIKIKPSKSMETIILNLKEDVLKNAPPGITKFVMEQSEDTTLGVADLQWLQEELCHIEPPCYLHELLKGCDVVLPEPPTLPRNPELEERVKRLRKEQEIKQYQKMTKNVDSVRVFHPEDSISYQIKQINRQMIAVAQFILSVAGGFAFGFIGIELIVGDLDFGFRLLLGVMFSLIIALAEIYFLAKKLSEEATYLEHPKPHQD